MLGMPLVFFPIALGLLVRTYRLITFVIVWGVSVVGALVASLVGGMTAFLVAFALIALVLALLCAGAVIFSLARWGERG